MILPKERPFHLTKTYTKTKTHQNPTKSKHVSNHLSSRQQPRQQPLELTSAWKTGADCLERTSGMDPGRVEILPTSAPSQAAVAVRIVVGLPTVCTPTRAALLPPPLLGALLISSSCSMISRTPFSLQG